MTTIDALWTLGFTWTEMGQDLEEGLGLMVVGMSIVFIALVIIGLMIKVTTWLLRQPVEAEAEAAETPEAALPAAEVETGMGPELIAVLTAAATAALNRPVRVHRVRHLSPQDIQGWVYSARAGAHRQPAYRKGRT